MHMLPRSQEVNIRRLYGSAKKAIDEIAKEKTETQKLEAVEKLVYESFLGNDGKFGQGSETAARDASKFTPETVSNFTRDIVSATTNAAANKPTQASLEPSDNLKKITKGPGLQASFRMVQYIRTAMDILLPPEDGEAKYTCTFDSGKRDISSEIPTIIGQ
ncbi:hypothetical protein sscle_08g064680 [Sclerotinia sclerotiorum 1980 UF-70]|uniref:Uncharacterized protein n=1 Tax=Sclerotinia sclerotiorum (strain ATCC 18683 / 1980 / Ss-1) TaxID=665079 RepID=A0A1D9Q9X2_SCLS1|nr:hypothetical protein sscle_08g064680 [Sclerotinia sclerotiorum 1980 UF-70]